MTKVNVNTVKLRECASDILQLETEYELLIKALFDRMIQVPTVTQEWIGGAAEKYSKIVASEKEQYLTYGRAIRQIGMVLMTEADSVESISNKTNGIH